MFGKKLFFIAIFLTFYYTLCISYNVKAEEADTDTSNIVVQGEHNTQEALDNTQVSVETDESPVEIDQDLIGDVNNKNIEKNDKEKTKDSAENTKPNVIIKKKNKNLQDTLNQYGDDFSNNVKVDKKSSKIKKKVKFEVSVVDVKDTKAGVATKNLQEAYKCYKNSDYEMAIYYYKRSLAENAKSVEAKFGLGVSYQLLHQYDQAINTYLSMLNKGYSRKKLISNLLLCLKHKTYQDALDILLSIDSKILGYADILLQIGVIYIQTGDNIKAISALSKAHELAPTDPIVAYNLGILYDKDHNIDYAKHFFELAVKNDIGDILTNEEAQELDLKMKELDEKIMQELTKKKK